MYSKLLVGGRVLHQSGSIGIACAVKYHRALLVLVYLYGPCKFCMILHHPHFYSPSHNRSRYTIKFIQQSMAHINKPVYKSINGYPEKSLYMPIVLGNLLYNIMPNVAAVVIL